MVASETETAVLSLRRLTPPDSWFGRLGLMDSQAAAHENRGRRSGAMGPASLHRLFPLRTRHDEYSHNLRRFSPKYFPQSSIPHSDPVNHVRH